MHRWFHPNLNNVEAERLLLECGQDASFLVRPSRSCAGHFSLSVRRRDKVTHIKIRNSGDFYDLHGGEQFATLAELVQYYTENQLREKNGEVFELKYPIYSSDPTTERWFHGSISGIVAEKLIREKGVNGSFLVRESQSKIGDYVLTVRTKLDKVTHVIIRHHENKYDVGGGEKFNSLTELVEHYKLNPMVETGGTVVNMKYPFNATSFTARDIDARVKELSKKTLNSKEGFWEEFEHIQHQECKVLFDRKVGQEEKNVPKNRYKNIIPYDHTRVILNKCETANSTTNHHDDISDTYINANYIKLIDDSSSNSILANNKPLPNTKRYIATQGPLPNTVNDFWWMVWQEKSDCIVMITNEIEKGKHKCYRYWPTKEQEVLQFGPIEVRLLSEEEEKAHDDDFYTHRSFNLRYLGNDRRMARYRHNNPVVHQYQYHSWPDQHTPSNPAGIANFIQNIYTNLRHNNNTNNPMIVHCSAGIGRSGALIVIDMLADLLRFSDMSTEIDIQHIVKIVRAQRSGLVQTEAQYKFIYLAIRSFIASRLGERKSLVNLN